MAIRMTGINSGLDTEAIIEQLMEAQKTKKTKIESSKTKLEWKQDAWKSLNTKLYGLYSGTLSKLKLTSTYNQKAASSNDETKVTAKADSTAVNGTNKIKVDSLASAQYVTGGVVEVSEGVKATKDTLISDLDSNLVGKTLKFKYGDGEEVSLEITAETKMSDIVEKAKEAGISANYDEEQGRFFFSSAESGTKNQFTITSDGVDISKLGITEITESTLSGIDKKTNELVDTNIGMTIRKAQDSVVYLNGAKLISSSTTLKANGITYDLKGVTGEEELTITVKNDVTAAYNAVKDFIKEYNEVLKEMNTNYYASSARDYDVLTSEQKEEMSDEEIENWEKKIKDSLLRRDNTLGTLITSMKGAMGGSVEVDGKNYSLSFLGITTSTDYKEKGLLHIYGDSDDSVYADKEDKLKTMLEEEPELVTKILSGFASNLHETMQDKMSSTSLSSAMTFYNDKQISKQLDSYEEEIERWEDKLLDMEDRYYKQFSAMETAMAKLNSQSSYISSLFAG